MALVYDCDLTIFMSLLHGFFAYVMGHLLDLALGWRHIYAYALIYCLPRYALRYLGVSDAQEVSSGQPLRT